MATRFGFKGCGVWGQSLRAVILNDNEDVVEVESFGFQAWGNPFRALQSLQALGPISGPFNKRFGRAHSPIRGPRRPCSQAFTGPLSQKNDRPSRAHSCFGPFRAWSRFGPTWFDWALSGPQALIGVLFCPRPSLIVPGCV